MKKLPSIKLRRIGCVLLSFLIFTRVGLTVFRNWQKYFSVYNFEAYKKVYESSQYVVRQPAGWIPDEAIYSYAAGAYLRGVNPILVNPEHPPLGKYIISLFICLFNREKLSILVCGVLSIILFLVLTKIVLNDNFWALFAVALLVYERLFIEQFVYIPLLDIIQLPFIFLSFIFFIKALSRSKFFFLTGLFLGAVAATKFYSTACLIFVSWVLFLVLFEKDKKKIFSFFLSLPLVFLVLAASYFRYFILGGTPRKFLGVLKWIFLFHKGKGISFLHFWALIFLNKWRVWWGERAFIPCVQWQVSWPISILGAILTAIFYFFKKEPFWGNLKIGVIISWTLVYLIFLSLTQVSPRYLISLLPFSHLVLVYGMGQLFKRK